MFKRMRDGAVIDKHFVLLSYPSYWHYNILFGLKVMAEAGFISDRAARPPLICSSLNACPMMASLRKILFPSHKSRAERIYAGLLGWNEFTEYKSIRHRGCSICAAHGGQVEMTGKKGMKFHFHVFLPSVQYILSGAMKSWLIACDCKQPWEMESRGVVK